MRHDAFLRVIILHAVFTRHVLMTYDFLVISSIVGITQLLYKSQEDNYWTSGKILIVSRSC